MRIFGVDSDHIPFVSTPFNIYYLTVKVNRVVKEAFSHITGASTDSVREWDRIDIKSFSRCLLLIMLPGFGNVWIYLYDTLLHKGDFEVLCTEFFLKNGVFASCEDGAKKTKKAFFRELGVQIRAFCSKGEDAWIKDCFCAGDYEGPYKEEMQTIFNSLQEREAKKQFLTHFYFWIPYLSFENKEDFALLQEIAVSDPFISLEEGLQNQDPHTKMYYLRNVLFYETEDQRTLAERIFDERTIVVYNQAFTNEKALEIQKTKEFFMEVKNSVPSTFLEKKIPHIPGEEAVFERTGYEQTTSGVLDTVIQSLESQVIQSLENQVRQLRRPLKPS